MSRLAWVAPACVLAAVVTGGLLGGPAAADEPTPSPSPSPTGTTQLLPVVPSPTPTPSRPSPVTRLRAAVDTTGALVVSWRAGAGDTSYTATATAQGRARHADATATSASFSGLPPGATVQIVVIAHGPGGDSTPVSITGAMPSVVPGVTGAAMHPVAAGMLVSWHAPTVAGVRYLVQLQGADGAVRSRLVSATSATVTGLTRGVLYTGSITVVTDTGRSAPVPVDGAVWTPPLPVAAAGPVAAPPPVPSSAPSATVVPHTTTPVLADSPARSTLVSSPIAAAALAGLAVVLGGVAIGLLLRRPRARGTSPLPQSVRSPRP